MKRLLLGLTAAFIAASLLAGCHHYDHRYDNRRPRGKWGHYDNDRRDDYHHRRDDRHHDGRYEEERHEEHRAY